MYVITSAVWFELFNREYVILSTGKIYNYRLHTWSISKMVNPSVEKQPIEGGQ